MNKENSYYTNYTALDDTLDNYSATFTQSYHNREETLIQALEERANHLKASIHSLRKKTSQEEIDKLIAKKKQEKEGQRLRLQKQWRELTEKLKKLQAEDKQLSNHNKEAAFDVSNLHEKIAEFKRQNNALKSTISELKGGTQKYVFLTEQIPATYSSPYKYRAKDGKSHQQSQSMEPDILNKLRSVRQVQMIPDGMLLQFLSRPEVKEQIYNMIQ